MDSKHLADLKNKLLEEKATIEAQLSLIAKKNPDIKGDWTTIRSDISDPSDTMDERAQGVTEFEERRAVEQNFELRLKEIDIALNKLKTGTYGVCDNCKDKIEPKRVTAMLMVALCMDCANKKTTFT